MSTNICDIFHEKPLVKICAPMVRYSKLQFRTLARKYGCDICYTPMIMADSFCQSQKARLNEFITNKFDTPLVVQFAAKTVQDFVGATNMILPYSNGVELNCGCPQRWAINDGYGCALLNQPELVSDLIHQCKAHAPMSYTISAKIRILDNLRKTIELCRCLEICGVSYITIHARTPTQRSEPINVEAIKEIKQSVSIPIVANGDIKSLDDAMNIQIKTQCDGVMAARGMLSNPAMFSGVEVTPLECVQDWVDICFNSVNDGKLESVKFPKRHSNLTFQCFHHHLVFMLEKVLNKKQRSVFNHLRNFDQVQEYLKNELNIVPQMYNEEDSYQNKNLTVDFKNRIDVYSDLKDKYDVKLIDNSDLNSYDSNESYGQYFESFVNTEDDDLMSKMFYCND